MLGRFLSSSGLAEDRCVICGAYADDPYQGYLCGNCMDGIKRDISIRPDRKLPQVQGFRVFSRYEGVLREIIRLVKFRRVVPLARRIGKAVAEDIGEYAELVSPDIITFVPVHIFRRWGRGFDQNEEILRGAGVEFENVLVRVKYSRPLARLSKSRRTASVRGAFRVRTRWRERIHGKRVLVFDDVITTGSTAVSVAETLTGAGASSVYFYFVAYED
ncbi:MAG: hypothetical protein Q9N26_02740 [Aquificota bacterium]|nr:hypothetical protein [Aquificota bacterium]